MNTLMRGAAALAAAAVGTAAYGAFVERNNFTLRRFTVPVLPPGAPQIRVLHLSDIHMMPWQLRKQEWIAGLVDLEPDLVIDTGDHISHPDSVPVVLDLLEPLLRLPGAFVLGSNDYFAPAARNPMKYLLKSEPTPSSKRLPTEALVLGLGEMGWRDLSNARGHLTVKGVEIALVGVDDPHLKYDMFHQIPAAPEHPTPDLKLGLLHAPYTRVLEAMTAEGVDLMFAGHTHGGQLAIPGYGAIVTNCDLDTRRVKGLSRWWEGANGIDSSHAPAEAAWLHVSGGLGTSPFVPIRIAARPEASLLTLTPREH
ncbi:phosphodiesterase YaeI [Dermatophilus congolensis]|uniref:Phosphodiesterase YaeI n=1 Tax=Dermatophilus congolensis TaxID=1863 RepID=A0AA46BQW2_9MICO|nr:metallophosphoesterase [Dermatophilus congolensis]STD15681.1 phosphodiesterase YaeI [Dermatophilus congolensis]